MIDIIKNTHVTLTMENFNKIVDNIEDLEELKERFEKCINIDGKKIIVNASKIKSLITDYYVDDDKEYCIILKEE